MNNYLTACDMVDYFAEFTDFFPTEEIELICKEPKEGDHKNQCSRDV